MTVIKVVPFPGVPGPQGPQGDPGIEVEITDPQDGDILKYNAATGTWYNTQP
jgi:hypothetical protein